MSEKSDELIRQALLKTQEPPVHIVQYQKSEKVLKFYSVLGKIGSAMLVLISVGLMGGILWWVFAEHLWQLMVLAGIVFGILGLVKACNHYEKHRKIVERAKKEGVIDD